VFLKEFVELINDYCSALSLNDRGWLMINLQLKLRPETAQRLKKILGDAHDQEMFAQNIIAYQIAELKKGNLNIRLDLKQFEEKYQMSTETFYDQFEQGKIEDSEDNMIWAGLCEMLEKNTTRLRELA